MPSCRERIAESSGEPRRPRKNSGTCPGRWAPSKDKFNNIVILSKRCIVSQIYARVNPINSKYCIITEEFTFLSMFPWLNKTGFGPVS